MTKLHISRRLVAAPAVAVALALSCATGAALAPAASASAAIQAAAGIDRPVAYTIFDAAGIPAVVHEFSGGTSAMRVAGVADTPVRISGIVFNEDRIANRPGEYAFVPREPGATATLDAASRTVTYTPAPGFVGTDRVEISVLGAPTGFIIDVLVGDGVTATTVPAALSGQLAFTSATADAPLSTTFDLEAAGVDPAAVLLTHVDAPEHGTVHVASSGTSISYGIDAGAIPVDALHATVFLADGSAHEVTLNVISEGAPTWQAIAGGGAPVGLERTHTVVQGALPDGAVVEMVSATDASGTPVDISLTAAGVFTYTATEPVGGTVTVTWRIAGEAETHAYVLSVVAPSMMLSTPSTPVFTWVDTPVTVNPAAGLGYDQEHISWQVDESLGGDAVAAQVQINGDGTVTYSPRPGWYGYEGIRLMSDETVTVDGVPVAGASALLAVHVVGPVATDKVLDLQVGETGEVDLTDGVLWGSESDLREVVNLWQADELGGFPAGIDEERALRKVVGESEWQNLSAGEITSVGYTKPVLATASAPDAEIFPMLASARFAGDYGLEGTVLRASAPDVTQGVVGFSVTTVEGFSSQTAEVAITVTEAVATAPVMPIPTVVAPAPAPVPAPQPATIPTLVVETGLSEPSEGSGAGWLAGVLAAAGAGVLAMRVGALQRRVR